MSFIVEAARGNTKISLHLPLLKIQVAAWLKSNTVQFLHSYQKYRPNPENPARSKNSSHPLTRLLQESLRLRVTRFPTGLPRSVYRHMYVSQILTERLPKNETIHHYDPFPPLNQKTIYDEYFESRPFENGNFVEAFIRSILPWVNAEEGGRLRGRNQDRAVPGQLVDGIRDLFRALNLGGERNELNDQPGNEEE